MTPLHKALQMAELKDTDWFQLPFKDAYGTPQPSQYGFYIAPLKHRFGNVDLGEKLDELLVSVGLDPINMWVGSHVHGYIHRKIYSPEKTVST